MSMLIGRGAAGLLRGVHFGAPGWVVSGHWFATWPWWDTEGPPSVSCLLRGLGSGLYVSQALLGFTDILSGVDMRFTSVHPTVFEFISLEETEV